MNDKQKQVIEEFENFTNEQGIGDIFKLMDKAGYRYSIYNAILVASQVRHRGKEEQEKFCNFMFSYNAWKSKGINVLKGQKGYYVYFPYFSVYVEFPDGKRLKIKESEIKAYENKGKIKKSVTFGMGTSFDISQTDGYEQHLKERAEIESKVYGERLIGMDIAKLLGKNIPIDIRFKDDCKHRGYYQPTKGKVQTLLGEVEITNTDEHICIGSDGDGDTLVHEIGHYFTYDMNDDYATNELKAEIFRCHVCRLLDKSFNYTYSNIWNRRLTEVLTLERFANLWKSIGKRAEEFVSASELKIKQAA